MFNNVLFQVNYIFFYCEYENHILFLSHLYPIPLILLVRLLKPFSNNSSLKFL